MRPISSVGGLPPATNKDESSMTAAQWKAIGSGRESKTYRPKTLKSASFPYSLLFQAYPFPSAVHSSVSVPYGNSFLMVGGTVPVGAVSVPSRDIYVFNAESESWSAMGGQLGEGRADHVAFFVDQESFPGCTASTSTSTTTSTTTTTTTTTTTRITSGAISVLKGGLLIVVIAFQFLIAAL